MSVVLLTQTQPNGGIWSTLVLDQTARVSKFKYLSDLLDLNSLQSSWCLSCSSLMHCLIALIPMGSWISVLLCQGSDAVRVKVVWAAPWQAWLCTLAVPVLGMEALCSLPLPRQMHSGWGRERSRTKTFFLLLVAVSWLLVISVLSLQGQEPLLWRV